MATAAAAVFALWGNTASALALGQITILSSLGEPLHAEIDIPEIDKEELATLRTSIAAPQAFEQAGLEYNPAMTNLQIRLKQKADGRHYLQLVSLRTINDPYVDLVIEARWSTGRILRDYTLLFDPPNFRKQAVTPTLPQQESSVQPVARPVQASPQPDQPPAPDPASAPVLPEQPADPQVAQDGSETAATPAQPEATPIPAQQVSPAPVDAPAAPTVSSPPPPADKPASPATASSTTPRPAPTPQANRVTIRQGDTAGRIARQHQLPDVSLDQMLVAMLRANPDALINGNINLIRTGAVMTLPTAEQAKGISSGEARQILVAQSKDFNAYRQKLAAQVPEVKVDSADRQASGKVQAKVQESKPTSPTPDKLTLSKGGAPSKGGAQAPTREDKVAKELKAKDTAQQAEGVSRNIEDLNKLGAKLPPIAGKAPTSPAPSQSPAPTAATEKTATPPVAAVAKAPPPATPKTATPPPAAAPKAATPPATAGKLPAPAAKKAAPPAPPPPEPDLLAELLDNPVLPAAGAGLVVLLAGLGFYRMRQRKQSEQISSAYLESKMQPDSFFGSSGGQRIDTNDGSSTNSSMVYSPGSQVDTADDVDPVAEADVYLAYGRDLQAEEILKEAQRNHPKRLAIHHKLLEIYAKRRDLSSFDATADLVHQLTGGEGDDWQQVCELGADLDPSNTRYNPNAQPADEPPLTPVEQAASASPEISFELPATAPEPVAELESDAPPSVLDLDLDFSLDEAAPEPAAPSYAAATEPMVGQAPEPDSLGMDFNLDLPGATATEPSPLDEPATASDNSLDFDLPALPETTAPAALSSAAPASNNGMEFDLSALSLDLGPPSEPPSLPPGGDDPLETKLALAEEFNAIGDADGARALIQEIISESSGEMRARAEQALAQLS